MTVWAQVQEKFPFENNGVIRTRDLDELEEKVYSRIDPRKSNFVEARNRTTDVRISQFSLAHSQFFGVSHQAPIRTRSSAALSSIQLSIPFAGKLRAFPDSQAIAIEPGDLYIHMPGEMLDLEWAADTMAILLVVNAAHFEQYLHRIFHSQLCQLDIRQPLLKLNSGLGLGLANTLSLLCAESQNPDSVLCKAGLSGGFEQLLFSNVCNLIMPQQPDNALPHTRSAMPGCVKRVVEYIEENCDKDLDISQLVEVSGVSLRSLQNGFSRQFDKGPMTYLRHVKLQKVRQALLDADPEKKKIIDVATEWGFYHQSHFARIYQEYFGELPTDTLKSNR